MTIDWGSVPDWLAGLGALVALIFARSAARSAKKTNVTQAEQIGKLEAEERRREERRRAAQAADVAVWVSSEADDESLAAIRYVNSSVSPVYSVLLCCHTPIGAVEATYPVLGPLSERRTLRGATAELRRFLKGRPFADWRDQGRVLVAISFRDAAGVWWCRRATGELREADDQAAARTGAREAPPSVMTGRSPDT